MLFSRPLQFMGFFFFDFLLLIAVYVYGIVFILCSASEMMMF